MKQLVFLFSFLAIYKIQSQPVKTNNFEFIDVNVLIKDLIKNDFISNYTFTLDYDAIITLDIASIPTLKKMDSWYFKHFDASEYKKKKKFRYDFSSKVKFKKIQTLFSDEKLFESIIKGQIKFSEFEEKIYTKK